MPSNRLAPFLRTIATLAAITLAPALLAGPDYQRWYTVDMLGHRSGWMMASQTTDAGAITTRSEISLSLRRGGAEVSIGFQSEFVETLDHKPVSMKSSQRTGTIPSEQSFTFNEHSLTATRTQGQETSTSEIPLPGGKWLTPAAAGDYVQAHLDAGDGKVTMRTIDPLTGATPVEVTHEVLAHTNLLAGGKSVPVTKCKVTQSDSPGIPTIEYLDAEGIPVQVETKVGAFGLTMAAAPKDEATAAAPAPEVMVSTLVKPDRRIARPRYKKHAVYTLSVPDGDALADLPQAGAQRFERLDTRTCRITVDVLDPLPAADAAAPEFLESSAMLNAADPAITDMARAAVKDAADTPAARAEAIRRFVHKSISTKDLDVGFATASETARTHEGDCTEHAVLLAAVLRAAKIPARVVSGLVYTEGFAGQEEIFGYHMWAQALLEGDGQNRWIDLDATLNGTTFDATHIALAVSALSDGQTYEAMAPMATVIGRLSIKVDSAE